MNNFFYDACLDDLEAQGCSDFIRDADNEGGSLQPAVLMNHWCCPLGCLQFQVLIYFYH